MKKTKILFICQHFWPENFRINDIGDFFVEKGAEIDVLCGLPNYPNGKLFPGYSVFGKRKEIHNKININRVLEIPRGNNSNFRILINYLSFPFFSLFHIPKLLFKKYDKIFLYQLSPVMMSVAGIIIGKIKKVETTIYVLDLWPENLFSVLKIKNNYLRKFIANVSHWHYKNVDKIIVLSKKMKNQLQKISNLPEDKIIIVPQCCEKIYENKTEDHTLKNRFKNFNVLYTGNISPAQSFETIIEAAKKLKKDKLKINLIIVGDGMSLNTVKTLVQDNDLEDIFYFEGIKPIEEIPKYTGIADVLVGCLVKSELLEATIPAKVTSYFAAGKPIVLSMDGEIQDIVNNNNCGFAGETEDSEALYKNIKKLYLMNKTERENISKNVFEYHKKHFERNNNLEKIYNFIIN